MAGTVVGSVVCPMCKKTADAKQESRGSKCLYISCDRCGVLQPRRFDGQVWMRANVELFDAAAPEPEPVPAAEPEPVKKAEKSGGIFSDFWGDD